MQPTITPFLWFDGQAEEAARLYVSLFPDAEVLAVNRQGEDGPVFMVSFRLGALEFLALNGGPEYRFSPATSFLISCDTQAEIDHFWAGLSEGGKPNHCGWLDDRFGMTWQVIPRRLGEWMSDPDPERVARVQQAMFAMTKLEIEPLRVAHAGDASPTLAAQPLSASPA